jgi:predicted phage terminase large subunit-like protein
VTRDLYGTIVPYKPPTGTDKIMRLHAQSDLFENGRVFLPQKAAWLADYVNELTGFPGTRYDDQVDSKAQALDHLRVAPDYDVWVRAFAD